VSAHAHGHSHGLVDPSITRSRAGLRAVSISLAVLLATALAQAAVFVATGSVALLSDLVHNAGDALTAIPLGAAFLLRSHLAERRAGYFVVATGWSWFRFRQRESRRAPDHPTTDGGTSAGNGDGGR